MPLLKLQTTVSLSKENTDRLLSSLSKIVAQTIGKPEQYVMVAISPSAILMAGSAEPAAFVDLRSIGGLNASTNRKLSENICAALADVLGIPPGRVYINFSDVAAANWGWNSTTFG